MPGLRLMRARNQTNGPWHWHIIPTAPKSPERPALSTTVPAARFSSSLASAISSQSCPQTFISHPCAQRLLFHGCCCRLCYSPSIGSSAGLWLLLVLRPLSPIQTSFSPGLDPAPLKKDAGGVALSFLLSVFLHSDQPPVRA